MFTPLSPEHGVLLSVLSRHADPVPLGALLAELPNPPERRTLQRWLAVLIDAGYATCDGRARAVRYAPTRRGILIGAALERRAAAVRERTRSANGAVTTGVPAAEPPSRPAAAPSDSRTPVTGGPLTSGAASPPPARSAPPAASVLASSQTPTIPVPANAATPAPAPHAVAAGSVSAVDPDFEPMFEMAIALIVGRFYPRQNAIIVLQSHAARNQKSADGMRGYVAYALAKLDALTPASAQQYRIDAATFARWRSGW